MHAPLHYLWYTRTLPFTSLDSTEEHRFSNTVCDRLPPTNITKTCFKQCQTIFRVSHYRSSAVSGSIGLPIWDLSSIPFIPYISSDSLEVCFSLLRYKVKTLFRKSLYCQTPSDAYWTLCAGFWHVLNRRLRLDNEVVAVCSHCVHLNREANYICRGPVRKLRLHIYSTVI
jgi:hypothetical protein